ncbi:hypothetical protein [endosymbiont GvMRE of Glomus versiforme]|uniref:hypothetical protein n=1 Tax=endosymbiont GvMRE of Glomus versiforme TaxID=2039283 RepID=UPI000EE4E42D|nr:hypothetical protein [endosymbiont GvMRE of Glomus versiforme]RHZ36662.1 hypothetical protein GvMRE_I2g395 [endosymbiont GvMRE of Glomus versiforme]
MPKVNQPKLKNSRSQPKRLTAEEVQEQFWDEVEEQSKQRVYEVLNQNIPLHNVNLIKDNWNVGGIKKIDALSKKVGFLPDKDTDFRVILRDEIPSYLNDDEEFQERITTGNWDAAEVDYAAQLVTFHYLLVVIKGINGSLQAYDCYDPSYLENLTEN